MDAVAEDKICLTGSGRHWTPIRSSMREALIWEEIMETLCGCFYANVEGANGSSRIHLPKALTRTLEQKGVRDLSAVRSPGPAALVLFPEASWQQYRKRLLANVEKTLREEFSRKYIHSASRVQVKSQGRLTLRRPLVEQCGLENTTELVLLGVETWIEVWDAQCWREYCGSSGVEES